MPEPVVRLRWATEAYFLGMNTGIYRVSVSRLSFTKRGVGILLLHPGWVKTDMGGENAPTMPVESVAGMRRVIDAFSSSDSGRFLNFRGEECPW